MEDKNWRDLSCTEAVELYEEFKQQSPNQVCPCWHCNPQAPAAIQEIIFWCPSCKLVYIKGYPIWAVAFAVIGVDEVMGIDEEFFAAVPTMEIRGEMLVAKAPEGAGTEEIETTKDMEHGNDEE